MQGFPDTFKLPCSDTQSYKQMGNSVPTKMIEEVAKEMLKGFNLEIWDLMHQSLIEHTPN